MGNYEKARNDLKALLQEQLSGDQREEWLRTLYESYTQRLMSDNERIWGTGAIMIPLSLGAFVILTAIDNPDDVQIMILGAASMVLMLVWVVIAENHRAFQNKSLAWVKAIEEIIGLDDTGAGKVSDNRFNRVFTRSGAVQWMRKILLVSVVVGWILIFFFWPR